MSEITTVSVTVQNSNNLLAAAEILLQHINDDGLFKCPNRLPYILTLAAFLEARLVESILHWGEIRSSIEGGNRHAKAFLTLNARAKLDTIFFIYSNGQYLTKFDSKEYQALVRLITIRNDLAHSKPYITTLDIEFTEEEDGSKSFILPQEFVDKSKPKANKLSACELEFMLRAAKELDVALDDEESYRSSPLCKSAQQVNLADR